MIIDDRRIYMAQAQARYRARVKSLSDWKETLKMTEAERAKQHEYRFRHYTRAKGLISDGEGYLERHEQRRAEEALNCLSQSSPVGVGGFGIHLTDEFEPKPKTKRTWWIR